MCCLSTWIQLCLKLSLDHFVSRITIYPFLPKASTMEDSVM